MVNAANAAIAPISTGFSREGLNSRVKDIETVSGGLSALTNQYNQLKATLGRAPELNFDDTKFLMTDSDFTRMRQEMERQVASLPDSEEKQAYTDAVDNYIEVVQARNQELLAYDSLEPQREAYEASNKVLQTSIEDLTTKEAQLQIKDVSGVLELIQSLDKNLLRSAYYLILQQSRALDYWTLKLADPPQEIADFGALKGVMGNLMARRLRAEEQTGNGPATIASLPRPLRFTLTEFDKKALLKTGALSFTITADNPLFEGYAQVLADSVTVVFATKASTDKPRAIVPLRYSLRHSGYNLFRDVNHKEFVFVSKPRTILFDVDSKGNQVLFGKFSEEGAKFGEQDDAYVGVSPFTSWTVQIINMDEVRDQLSKVKELQVQIQGTARAFEN
jgi:hypothetical protein